MKALIVADESVDFLVVISLRESGFNVVAIAEEHPGWPDTEVLEFAFAEKALLITEDKDFGELTYRLQKPSHGILLIRMMEHDSETKASYVLALLLENFDRFWNAFSVLETFKLRIRSIHI
jgi:predicted nuclease of predicted toxin-antitoxin system